MTMAQAFQHVAGQHPGREALVCGPQRATYGQLAERVESPAHGLQELGIGKGGKVATLLYPCPEFIYLFFALAKLGGVIVPINPQFRRRQLSRILSDAEPVAVVTSARVGEEALETIRGLRSEPSTLRDLILTEGGSASELPLADLISAGPTVPFSPPPVDPHYVLALLYTSGTTGFPKGAMHSHRSLIAPVVASLRLRQMWISRPSPRMMGRWARVLDRYGPRLLRAVGRSQAFLSTVGCHNITGLEVILQALLMGDRVIMMDRFNPLEGLRFVLRNRPWRYTLGMNLLSWMPVDTAAALFPYSHLLDGDERRRFQHRVVHHPVECPYVSASGPLAGQAPGEKDGLHHHYRLLGGSAA